MSKFRNQHMKISWDALAGSGNGECAADASLAEKSALVGRLGLMMLSVGAGAYRVRAAMNKASRAMGRPQAASDIADLVLDIAKK